MSAGVADDRFINPRQGRANIPRSSDDYTPRRTLLSPTTVSLDRSPGFSHVFAMHPLLLMGAFFFQLGAAPPQVSADDHLPELAEFHDSTGQLGIEAVTSSVGGARFEVLSGPVPYRRGLNGNLWIRFRLSNEEPHLVRRYVRVEWLRLGEITFFAITPRGIRKERSGFTVKFSDRPEWGRDLAFPVDLAAGETHDIYLRVQTVAEVRVPIRVVTDLTHARLRAFGNLSTGAFAGMLLSLSVFSVVVFARLRHPMYLFFALHMTWFLAWWLFARGWGAALDIEGVLIYWLFGTSLDIWLFARLAFTRSLLDLKIVAPRLNRHLFGIQIIGIPLLFVSQSVAPASAGFTGSLAPLILLGLELYAGTVAFRAGSRLAPWFLVATGCLLAGLLLAFVIFSGALPLGIVAARWTIRIGVLGELFGLAFVLAESIRSVSQERERALGQVEAERLRASHQLQMVEQVRLREREQIARDLHDSIAHHVSGIAIRAQSGLATARTDSSPQIDALHAIENEASKSLAEMRTILGSLRREDLDHEPHAGLMELEQLGRAEVPSLPVALHIAGDRSHVSAGAGRAVYRIIQEGITNARRHANGATFIKVVVSIDPAYVRFEIVNDGAVVSAPTVAGYGLLGMKERAQLLGGHLEAGPTRTGGWRVAGSLPLQPGSGSVPGVEADPAPT